MRSLLGRVEKSLHDQPIQRATTAHTLAAHLPAALPRHGRPVADLLEQLWPVIVGHARRNNAPGFFGYVCGAGLPTDPPMAALAAALNQNVTGFASAPGATVVERRLLQWLCQLAGLKAAADGVLLSGGSLANFTALATALHTAAGDDPAIAQEGLAAVQARLRVYLAPTAHFSNARAVKLAGLGRRHIVAIPVAADGRIDVDALTSQLREDKRAGLMPAAVVATAGSTTQGLVDPLARIAELCRDEGVWLHVDAAYGGAALLAPDLRGRLAGIEAANSITLDLHKWFYMGFDASAVLFAEPHRARDVFYTSAEYVDIERDPPPERHAFFHYGPETSRRFRALGPFVALCHYGRETLAANISHNAACARYLAGLVEAADDLQLIAQPDLSICCFRWCGRGYDRGAIDRMNQQIQQRLLAEGSYYLSPTTIAGRPVLRVCVQGHQTNADTMDGLVATIQKHAYACCLPRSTP